MEYLKLTSVDGFVLFDFEGLPASGVARRARKVLRDSATMLARTTTYSYACFGVQACGASAGLNVADDDDVAAALTLFVDELRPFVESGRLTLDPAVGIDDTALAPLHDIDRRPSGMHASHAQLVAAGAIAAARGVAPEAATAAFIGIDPAAEIAAALLADAEIAVIDNATLADATDLMFLAGKTGCVDHEAASAITARAVVPLTPLPITAKAHAVLERSGVVHIPDFLAQAAPLLAGDDPDGGDPIERITAVTADLLGSERGLWWGAIERAETAIKSWNVGVPFGRPLA